MLQNSKKPPSTQTSKALANHMWDYLPTSQICMSAKPLFHQSISEKKRPKMKCHMTLCFPTVLLPALEKMGGVTGIKGNIKPNRKHKPNLHATAISRTKLQQNLKGLEGNYIQHPFSQEKKCKTNLLEKDGYAVTQRVEQGQASSQQRWALLQKVKTKQSTVIQKPLLPLGDQSLSGWIFALFLCVPGSPSPNMKEFSLQGTRRSTDERHGSRTRSDNADVYN